CLPARCAALSLHAASTLRLSALCRVRPRRPFPSCATAPPALHTLSLHDALPISARPADEPQLSFLALATERAVFSLPQTKRASGDRKSTRLNSSHQIISYAVFCLKKKKTRHNTQTAD